MMLHKSLVSFITAFAVATSVTASAIPVARNGGSECNTGTLQCCDSTSSSANPVLTSLASMLDIALPVDASTPIGISCSGVLSSVSCTAQSVCCNNVSQSGLINIGCSPINLGL